MEFYLAFNAETRTYDVRFYNDLDQDCLHSTYHKFEIARNTMKQLQERADAQEDAG